MDSFKNNFIHLFLAVPGLHSCADFSLGAMHGFLTAVASAAADHGLQGFSSHGSQVLQHRLNSCGERA